MAGHLFSTLTSASPYDNRVTYETSHKYVGKRIQEDDEENEIDDEDELRSNGRQGNERARFVFKQKSTKLDLSRKKVEIHEERRELYMRPVSNANPYRCSARMQKPRMSLWGKPIEVQKSRLRDQRMRRYQMLTHNFLERPRGFKSLSYHLCV